MSAVDEPSLLDVELVVPAWSDDEPQAARTAVPAPPVGVDGPTVLAAAGGLLGGSWELCEKKARYVARRRVYLEMSDAAEANVALVRRTYALWNIGGPDPLVRHIWRSDVVFYETPEMPDTGVYRGVEAVAARMWELIEAGGHLQLRVCSLEGCGDYVLAICEMRATGASSGLRLKRRICHVMRCAGGRVREFRAHFDCRQARRDYQRLCAPTAANIRSVEAA